MLEGVEFRVFRSLVREWDRDTPKQIEVELSRNPVDLEEVEAALERLEDAGWLEEYAPGRWRLSGNGEGCKRSLLGAIPPGSLEEQ